jgi:hypothetical protein
MPLIKVKKLDYSARFAYAPPVVDAVINTEEVVSAAAVEERGTGPFLQVCFRDGSTMTIKGTADTLVPFPAEPE